MTEKTIIAEFGVEETGRAYVCERPFLLRTLNGPLQRIEPGTELRLTEETGKSLFYAGKVRPISLPDLFEVLTDFREVGPDGLFIWLCSGDIVKLEPGEALHLLREGRIKPKGGQKIL
jgi:hypothetical protein